ncbi:MAG: hypothetical protein SVU69_00650 [Pseudomonadota bacterium]|nr:hypothetical protein [Pseudomonadota bacterium]
MINWTMGTIPSFAIALAIFSTAIPFAYADDTVGLQMEIRMDDNRLRSQFFLNTTLSRPHANGAELPTLRLPLKRPVSPPLPSRYEGTILDHPLGLTAAFVFGAALVYLVIEHAEDDWEED